MPDLNEGQKKAIYHVDGPMMVLAGPGSGKTFVITRRLEYLIKEAGIMPENILVITFTKASAIEMESRFESLMDGEYAPVTFGTFHAIYFKILKEHLKYDASNIVTEREKRVYMKTVLSAYNDQYFDDDIVENLLSDISKIKNDGIEPDDYNTPSVLEKEVFKEIYYEYNGILEINRKLDFDDMVLKCRALLIQNADILDSVRQQYKYILIDEFQDINPMQYDVIKMIAEPLFNLFIVGDDDQSIYGFRGSKPEIMLAFPETFPGSKRVDLNINYRSASDIVNKAVSFICKNESRYSKVLKANNQNDRKVKALCFENKYQETDYIIKMLTTAKRKNELSKIAVIFRTNKGAKLLTKELALKKIPYKFKDRPTSFFKHAVSLDILAILAFAYGENTRKNFFRFMNKPVRYISRSLIDSEYVNINELYSLPQVKPYLVRNLKQLEYDINKIRSFKPYAAINYIRRGMGYENYILSDTKEKKGDIEEVKNILELVQNSARDMENLAMFRESIIEYEDSLLEADNMSEDMDAVTLITMHGSKGLEYENVILPDINEGNVPQEKAKKPSELEEERRVFYVAMTRAKQNLIIMYLNKNKDNKNPKSRFINEIEGLEVYSSSSTNSSNS